MKAVTTIKYYSYYEKKEKKQLAQNTTGMKKILQIRRKKKIFISPQPKVRNTRRNSEEKFRTDTYLITFKKFKKKFFHGREIFK